MRPERRPAAERELVRLLRKLDAGSRESLLAFAQFLATRDASPEHAADVPDTPRHEPRPAEETVVAAIRRMRRTYPMLDGATMLNETSTLMAAHVIRGRGATEVIDELEDLFAARFAELKGGPD